MDLKAEDLTNSEEASALATELEVYLTATCDQQEGRLEQVREGGRTGLNIRLKKTYIRSVS